MKFWLSNVITPYDMMKQSLKLHDSTLKVMISEVNLELFKNVFVLYEDEMKRHVFELLTMPQKEKLLNALPSDEIVYLFKRLKRDTITPLWAMFKPIKRQKIQSLIKYQKTKVGAMMTLDMMVVDDEMTVGAVMKQLIHQTEDQDFIDVIWVVDEKSRLAGYVGLNDLVISRKQMLIKNIMETQFDTVHPEDDIEHAIDYITDYDELAMAVIDDANHIIGMISADDILEEVVDQLDEDYMALAGLMSFDHEDLSIERYQKRMPWLLVALMLNIIMITVLTSFETTLSAVTALVLFQPLVLGMAGNIATQSLGVTILDLDEDDFSMKRHVRRELLIGSLNALLIGAFGYVLSTLFLWITGVHHVFEISSVVSVSIVLGMLVASTMGYLIPIVLKHFNKDPAVASGPLITTLNDFISLLIYFSVATLLLI
jgi:magnesium transporter